MGFAKRILMPKLLFTVREVNSKKHKIERLPPEEKRFTPFTLIDIIRLIQRKEHFMPYLVLTAEVPEEAKKLTKETLKKILTLVFDNKLYYALFLLALMLITLKIIGLCFRPFRKKNSIHMSFLKSVIQAMTAIAFLLQIGSLSDTFTKFSSSILMSSSLIVVVLGFVFQEGLSNIVHGFILIIFKPFDLGDRVKITIDGQQISGYVKNINLRNTIIQNVANNSFVIIPNAKMDLGVIDNSYFDAESVNSNFLDISVTYESDLEKACAIMSECITRHPLVREARKPEDRDKPVDIVVCNLADSGIALRASVVTKTIEENFGACSDIRRELVYRFSQEEDVDFAYPHMVVRS